MDGSIIPLEAHGHGHEPGSVVAKTRYFIVIYNHHSPFTKERKDQTCSFQLATSDPSELRRSKKLQNHLPPSLPLKCCNLSLPIVTSFSLPTSSPSSLCILLMPFRLPSDHRRLLFPPSLFPPPLGTEPPNHG